MPQAAQNSGLTVIIPSLNAVESLPATLDALAEGQARGLIGEIILVDGNSVDGTQALAASRDVTVVTEMPGRGGQLAAGAARAAYPWLLFLHADTRLAPGWCQAVEHFMSSADAQAQAGFFALALDDQAPQARRIERLANWRARRLKLPYGDQGLLLHRQLYEQAGGYKALLLMEDVDLVRRIGRRRLRPLEGQAMTSAKRYQRDGWWARPLRNLCLLSLYFFGLPPRWLQRLYG